MLVALGVGASKGDIEYSSIPGIIVDPVILSAVVRTIVLAIIAQGGAILLGIFIALMRISKNPVARVFSWLYVWIFRGLPTLLQIMLWYNMALVFPRVTIGIPFTNIILFDQSTNKLISAFVAALLGLGLNESAYMAEIVRAGLQSVDKGQREAAASLGMKPGKVMSRVVLPQAMRVIIPPTGNDFINMLKGTSQASVIGFAELIHASNSLSSYTLLIMETLIAAAFWYMVIVSIANVGQYFLERKYNPAKAEESGGLIDKIIDSLKTPPALLRKGNRK
ncbi:amino acid ABC transporter permease [Bifidobacterium sp. ESL0775]|uniref:amino acid ABC transporter permease n=1 Tax=Bifidobacterium sp. ESL0775 TaxID=2983230 RepID=UPI0023F96900|nr:amino acid ABC transporter permease [Bifidobacterium sp. ESL0775]WEV69208.1 amino acid ABC transporter permease [Bifidobacterium sp. ESL0775]